MDNFCVTGRRLCSANAFHVDRIGGGVEHVTYPDPMDVNGGGEDGGVRVGKDEG